MGGFEITCIRTEHYHWDGGAIFGVVPKTLWSKKTPADESNRVEMAFNCYVIRTGDHTILVETGEGGKMDEKARARMKLAPVHRPLAEIIAARGIDPEAIDIVVNTHLHFDHCGGNTVIAGDTVRPAFPRARYYTRRGEWEHAHERHVRDSVSYLDVNYDPLVDAGRMELIADDREIVPGVQLHLAPGHNRDMMMLTASSEGKTFCFFSDLIPTAAHLTPSWVSAFDLFPLTSIDNKARWVSEVARGEWICGFGHDKDIAFARINSEGRVIAQESYANTDAVGIS